MIAAQSEPQTPLQCIHGPPELPFSLFFYKPARSKVTCRQCPHLPAVKKQQRGREAVFAVSKKGLVALPLSLCYVQQGQAARGQILEMIKSKGMHQLLPVQLCLGEG